MWIALLLVVTNLIYNIVTPTVPGLSSSVRWAGMWSSCFCAVRFVALIYKPKGAPRAACYIDNGLVDDHIVATDTPNGFLNHRVADRTRHLSPTNDLPA